VTPLPPASRPASAAATATGTTTNPGLQSSLAYYRETARLIRDLKGMLRNAKDYEKTAMWHDNYARRIDDLPIAGVDAELVTYGADLSQYFRAVAASLRGESVRVNALNQSVTAEVQVNSWWGYTGYKYGAFGGYVPGPGEVQTNLRQVREAQAQAVSKGAEDRVLIWQMIDDRQNRVRIAMTKKYGVEFDVK
jgi:hypothetical protein